MLFIHIYFVIRYVYCTTYVMIVCDDHWCEGKEGGIDYLHCPHCTLHYFTCCHFIHFVVLLWRLLPLRNGLPLPFILQLVTLRWPDITYITWCAVLLLLFYLLVHSIYCYYIGHLYYIVHFYPLWLPLCLVLPPLLLYCSHNIRTCYWRWWWGEGGR